MRHAQECSLKTGQIIVAYQCPDCRRFHIGHADSTQLLVREQELNSLPRSCTVCGGFITPAQQLEAISKKRPFVYCSQTCEQSHTDGRKQYRRRMSRLKRKMRRMQK